MYDKIPDRSIFPFSIPAIRSGDFSIEFKKPVTIIVGENGTGKSSILEAIAANCGFSLTGGTRNHVTENSEKENLSEVCRLSWLPRVSTGFFLRAETFFSFIQSIDNLADSTGTDIYQGYGGKSLRERSHGEAFLSLFENRFGKQGIFILDEPEAALSPQRQVEFLRVIDAMETQGQAQVIIATHSVMIMGYPNAQVIKIDNSGAKEIDFTNTSHFQVMADYISDPENFMKKALDQ